MFERLRRQVGQLGLAKAIVALRGIVLLAGKDDACDSKTWFVLWAAKIQSGREILAFEKWCNKLIKHNSANGILTVCL